MDGADVEEDLDPDEGSEPAAVQPAAASDPQASGTS